MDVQQRVDAPDGFRPGVTEQVVPATIAGDVSREFHDRTIGPEINPGVKGAFHPGTAFDPVVDFPVLIYGHELAPVESGCTVRAMVLANGHPVGEHGNHALRFPSFIREFGLTLPIRTAV